MAAKKYERTLVKLGNFYSLDLVALLFGVVGFAVSVTPSLMPRPPIFIGIVAGLSFMVSYGVGLALQRLLYWLLDKEPVKEFSRRTRLNIYVISAAVLLLACLLSRLWQNDVRQAVGMAPLKSFSILTILLAFIITASLVLSASRGIRTLFRAVQKRVNKIAILPRRIALVVSLAVFLVLLSVIVNGVLARGLKAAANAYFSSVNDTTEPDVSRPTSLLRSGSSQSLVSWDTLGRNGRSFVGTGPTAKDISEFTGAPALEPIRVYVSERQAPSPEARAALAVKELERTHAFDRKIIVVSTTTGSGWIPPASATAVEYIHGGDTAQVAIQYSYLPSWMALLVSKQEATDSGRALFDAVYDHVQQLPADKRPKLIAFGLSLGAYGGEAAFSGANDFAARADGALSEGTPGFSDLWQYFTNHRDPGSLQIKPVYRGAKVVHFANNSRDLAQIAGSKSPRMVYFQYASDPITWWNPELIWSKPDWLREPRGKDVSNQVHWYPAITFLQVSVDQFFANDIAGSHGHDYTPDTVAAWVAATSPRNWSAEQSAKLQNYIDATFSPTTSISQ